MDDGGAHYPGTWDLYHVMVPEKCADVLEVEKVT